MTVEQIDKLLGDCDSPLTPGFALEIFRGDQLAYGKDIRPML